MSGPSVSCPPEIAELRTISVEWESFLGFDGHAEPSYAAPVTLKCWQEAHGMTDTGSLIATRKATETEVEPQWDLYFSGDDPNALLLQLYDRFTANSIGAEGEHSLQAVRINTMYGPNWDNVNPWLIVVSL